MSVESPAALAMRLAGTFGVPAELVEQLHDLHGRQWALEDLTRKPGKSAHEIARTKADIDACNARRHRLIDLVDSHATITTSDLSARHYSETVGELCDRLLILDLKHQALMDLSAEDRPARTEAPVARQEIVATTRHLGVVVDQLIEDGAAGRAVLPPRLGIKIYNGAASNAQLSTVL